jgi:hypothetical protein
MVHMYPIILSIIALMAASLHVFFQRKKPSRQTAVTTLLAYLIPISIGGTCLIGFVAHLFFGPQTAALIGWPADNPFQQEVGLVNLALAVAAVLCIWMRKGFWLATIVITAVFFLGAAGVHLVQEYKYGNTAPYNSGIFLYVADIALPLVYLALGYLYGKMNKWFLP